MGSKAAAGAPVGGWVVVATWLGMAVLANTSICAPLLHHPAISSSIPTAPPVACCLPITPVPPATLLPPPSIAFVPAYLLARTLQLLDELQELTNQSQDLDVALIDKKIDKVSGVNPAGVGWMQVY